VGNKGDYEREGQTGKWCGAVQARPMNGSACVGLAIVLLVAAGIRLWNLGGHDFGNIYYAAAVRSMANGWHNLFYGSFDPASFLAIDRPPFGFWPQALSVRLIGYSGWSLHLPQVIEGLLVVVLVYGLTRQVAGEWGAVVAGLVIAVMPASVAADRSNLADSSLVLMLLLAAWAIVRATGTGRWRWLLLSTALVGIAFNVKMMVAYGVLPTFFMLYMMAAPVGWRKRIAQLFGATIMLVVVSFAWAVFVDTTPVSSRPYIGDTRDNSTLSLMLGSKGVGNVTGAGRPSGDPSAKTGQPLGPPSDPPGLRDHGPGWSPEPRITGHGGRPGPLRLANRDLAGHITWLIPFAAVGLAALALMSPPRWPLSPVYQAVLLWGGWFATYAVIFSLAHAPIHPYYLHIVAPAVAALTGIGAVQLGKVFERGGWWLTLPIASIALTVLWHLRVLEFCPAWQSWLRPVVLAGSVISVALLLLARVSGRRPTVMRRAGGAGLALGLATLFVCPTAWSLTPLLAPGGRMVPIADPALLEHGTDSEVDSWSDVRVLADFLQKNRAQERFLLAAPDIHLAAPVIIVTGQPVMAYGGFGGGDPILTVEEFAAMVEAGQVRFVLLPGQGAMGQPRPAPRNAIEKWVRQHGREVPEDRWRAVVVAASQTEHPSAEGWGDVSAMLRRMFRDPRMRLYDCRSAIDN